MKKWIGISIGCVIWQLMSWIIAKRIFPAPLDVFLHLLSQWSIVMGHSLLSLYRLTAGMLLAVGLGMPLGILLGYFKKLSDMVSPIVYFLAPIPKIALLPLIMLFFGIGDGSKIFIIFIIMIFQVVVAVYDAVQQIPKDYFLSFYTIKASHRAILWHIVIPGALPGVFTAIRLGLATSLSVLFFAETFGTTWGLGFYIMDMWMRLNYAGMYSGIIVLGSIGLIS